MKNSIFDFAIIMIIYMNVVNAQNAESYIIQNMGRIVEVANPDGNVTPYHILLGNDTNGYVMQANSQNVYKIFGAYPNATYTNAAFNLSNKFGAPSGHDGYEIRFGNDSSHYWIGSVLASNQVPFSVYNVGPKAPDNPSLTGGVKLCIQVTDENNDSIYTPGEKITVYGDLALPLDSTYSELGMSSTIPFPVSKRYFTNFRTGNSSVSYSSSTFNVLSDGIIPPHGTVIRLIAKTSDTTKACIVLPDSLIALKNKRYAYPFSYYSFEPPTVNLINPPEGMTLHGDSIIWNVSEAQLGQQYNVTVAISNSQGANQKTIMAKAYARIPEIDLACGMLNADSIYQNMLYMQNFGTRNANNPIRRNVAEWIKSRFLSFGYTNTVIDSFLGNFGWDYNVIAILQGQMTPDSIYVIGGHHDCIATNSAYEPGADDNASGTAVVLETARVLKTLNYQPGSTILFITFAAEEYGLWGSEYCAAFAQNNNLRIQMMINNDNVANCTDIANSWIADIYDYPNSVTVQNLAHRAIEQYTTLGYTQYPPPVWTDSRSFNNHGYEAIALREHELSPFYHTANDVLSNCNMLYATEMAKISCAMLIMANGNNVINIVPDDETAMPSGIRLYQNYPNPFNPSTTIKFQIAEASPVSIIIYNILGQKVVTLVNDIRNQGTYSVTWNGQDDTGKQLSSGIYICRMTVNNISLSRKMLVIK